MFKTFVRSRRFLLVAPLATCAGAMTISACDDDPNPTEGLSGGAITVAVTPTDLTVAQGSSGTAEVTIGRSGEFAGPIVLKTGTQPEGVALGLTPTVIDEGVTTSVARVTVDAAAIPGTYHITVAGTASNVSTGQATMTIVVTPGEAPPPAAAR